MADDDDDDDFGEFTFASNQTTASSSSHIPVTTGGHEWGDFNNFQYTTDHNLKSPQPQTQTQPKWVKIQGALPLSVFGDEEEPVMPQSSFSGNSGFVSNNNNDKSNAHPGMDDLIANLYGQRQQQHTIKAADNGNDLDFTAIDSTVPKDPLSKSESWSSFSFDKIAASGNNDKTNAHADLFANLYGQRQQQHTIKAADTGNGFDFTTMDSTVPKDPLSKSESWSSFSSNKVVASGNNDKSNAHMGFNDLIANLYGQRQQQQTAKVVDDGNGLDFTAINSTPSKDPLSKSHSVSSFSLNTVAASGNHGSDDEGGWEFVDAFSDSKLAQNEKDNKERSEKAVSPLGLHEHGPIDLFTAPKNREFVESHGADRGFDSKPVTNVQNGFTADFKATSVSITNDSNSNPLGGSVDIDDDFGEFEAAFVEQPSKKKELSEERNYPLGSHDAFQGSVDLFKLPNGLSGGSQNENNGFDFRQSPVVQNGFASDLFSQTEWKETKDGSDSQPSGAGADHETFGKFETTFPEAESKPEGSEASSKNYKEPVPLSIFGIEEEPETDSSLNLQHEFFKSSTHGNNMQNQSSKLSINDILSNLYSQAEPTTSAYHERNPEGEVNSLYSTSKEYSSYVVDDDDNFDDGSWEFKDASPQSRPENPNLPFKKKLQNCMDFYSILKDELCLVARHHLHGLKKAESTATLVGEEMKATALNKEMQEALEELQQKDILSAEVHSDDHLEPVISLKQYIETLQEPDYQVLESEYHISRRLSLAESDLQTAIGLINHFTTVLMILTQAPKDEPANYVSIWYKVISACSQELQHGTWIWKQSLEKNVHSEILSDLQGKQFIIALGEIYRVVVILGAAVKFYKPWLLLSGADLEGIYALLEECHSLWSTSGLEEAIPVESLLESIKNIQNLDELAIANEVFSQEESRCWLSLLSPGVVPEMKMVDWNGDKYFVTVANLWANLISPDPPKLCIHVN